MKSFMAYGRLLRRISCSSGKMEIQFAKLSGAVAITFFSCWSLFLVSKPTCRDVWVRDSFPCMKLLDDSLWIVSVQRYNLHFGSTTTRTATEQRDRGTTRKQVMDHPVTRHHDDHTTTVRFNCSHSLLSLKATEPNAKEEARSMRYILTNQLENFLLRH